MRKRIGIFCIFLGVVCLLGAIGLAGYNRFESSNAAKVSEALLKDVRQMISKQSAEQGETLHKMPAVQVDGDACIGVLSIPALELELPVLADWSYDKLKKAPCRYYGSCYESNFVIAAHNYEAHFGSLSELQAGDVVVFTDAGGKLHYYEVVLLETLLPSATKEMIEGGFDLSLYTCTFGGGSRVTVRCNAVE